MPPSGDITTTFATWQMDHTGITTNCISCHGGATFVGVANSKPKVKSSGHIPVTVDCAVCHSSTTVPGGFSLWTMNHSGAGITSGCNKCHGTTTQLFAGVINEPIGHVPTGTRDCLDCHTNTNMGGFGQFTGTGNIHPVTDPRSVSFPNCSSCHDGSAHPPTYQNLIPGMVSGHIAVNTGTDCISCHRYQDVSFAQFSMSTAEHTKVSGTCTNCHTVGLSFPGTTIKTKAAVNHIPTVGACSTCHTGSNNTLNPNGFKTPDLSLQNVSGGTWASSSDHTGLGGTCISCHGTGKTYTGVRTITSKPGHVPIGTSDCGTCHLKTAFLPASGHVLAYAGKCLTCHNTGPTGNPKGKIANHIATAASCDVCHTTWTTHLANETGVFADCSTDPKSCMGATGHTAVSATCASCHLSTGNQSLTGGTTAVTVIGIAAQHIPINTGASCVACHAPTNFDTFSRTWTAAMMSHAAVSVTSCNACHASPANASFTSTPALVIRTAPSPGNGPNASGHIPVTGDCAVCHTSGNYTSAGFTQSWSATSMKHTAVDTGTCSGCHAMATTDYTFATNVKVIGSQTSPPPSGTVAYHTVAGNAPSADCKGCHTSLTSFANATNYTHIPGDAGQCRTCHAGSAPTGKTIIANHIATTAQCDVCHTTWSSHLTAEAGIFADCSTSPKTCMGATGHAAVTAPGACNSCHLPTGNKTITGGATTVTVVGLAAKHIPIASGAACETCHGSGYTSFSRSDWQTAMVHNSAVVSLASCNACHASPANTSFTSTTPLTIRTTPTQGAGPNPSGHIQVTGDCATCHTSGIYTSSGFTQSWAAGMNHSAVNTGTCKNCHAMAVPDYTFATNVAVIGSQTPTPPSGTVAFHTLSGNAPTSDCNVCHTSTTTFAGAAGHTHTSADANNCLNCHNGTNGGMIKITNHITTGASCDVCHTTWSTQRANETGVFAACSTSPKTCMGAAGHAVVSATCSSCHLASGNQSIAGGTTAVTVVGLATPHIPITSGASCVACHDPANFTTFSRTWTAAMMSHASVSTGTCNTCHASPANTSFKSTPALTIRTTPTQAAGPNPSGHIPVTGDCAVCHTSGNYTATGFTQSWTAANMQHGAVNTGTCAGCHAKAVADYTFATGVKVIGSQTTPAPSGTSAYHTLTGNAPTGDCSSCHTSLTSFGGAAGHVHTPADATKCNTCHAGTGGGKTQIAGHILTTASCDVCHGTGSYLATTPTFTVWTMNHSGVTATSNCISCHNGQTFGATTSGTYDKVPKNKANTGGRPHVTTALQCDVCHSGTTTFANGTMTSAAHTSNGNTTSCVTCHGRGGVGTNIMGFTGNLPPKPQAVGHITTTGAAACEGCHTNTATFAGQNTGWVMGATQHTTTYVTLPCSSCHNGQTFATGVTPKNLTSIGNHIPVGGAPFNMPLECSSCHNSTTTFTTVAMTNATAHGNFKGQSSATVVVTTANSCAACHSTNISGGWELTSRITTKTLGNHEKSTKTQDCVSSCHHSVKYTSW
jgi:hypothetical protein